MPEPLLTEDEAAAAIGVDVPKLRQLHEDGRIPAIKLNRRQLRFTGDDVDDFLDSVGVDDEGARDLRSKREREKLGKRGIAEAKRRFGKNAEGSK